jgi:hypothetical protein
VDPHRRDRALDVEGNALGLGSGFERSVTEATYRDRGRTGDGDASQCWRQEERERKQERTRWWRAGRAHIDFIRATRYMLSPVNPGVRV